MNISDEAGKNSNAVRIKCHWVEKKFLQDLLLFCVKPSLKSTLFSPAIADIWMNKQTIKQTNQKMFVFAWCVSG